MKPHIYFEFGAWKVNFLPLSSAPYEMAVLWGKALNYVNSLNKELKK